IGAVLVTLAQCPWLRRVVVVDDGSNDETGEVACATAAAEILAPLVGAATPGQQDGVCPAPVNGAGTLFHVIRHTHNAGKAQALITAIAHTEEPYLLMVDADLQGFAPEHLEALALPVARGDVAMTTGIFKGGRLNTDLAHVVAPGLSGQRALTREVWERFLARGDDPEALRYGVEEILEDLVKHGGVSRALVEWRGVTHTTKEEKVGLVAGWAWRLSMYRQVLRARLGADWKALRGQKDE
ncbi:MAG TPA: glycosyltransferase, partial [bacterium]|nr:glycosyltransferase [bacterium]